MPRPGKGVVPALHVMPDCTTCSVSAKRFPCRLVSKVQLSGSPIVVYDGVVRNVTGARLEFKRLDDTGTELFAR